MLTVSRIGKETLVCTAVPMMGRVYDFKINTTTREVSFRETSHVGETFQPITDNARYAPEVRKTFRKVVCEFLTFQG